MGSDRTNKRKQERDKRVAKGQTRFAEGGRGRRQRNKKENKRRREEGGS